MKNDIGYSRCSTDKQALTAQRRVLIELGVPEDRIYTDHGLTGRTRQPVCLVQVTGLLHRGNSVPHAVVCADREGRGHHRQADQYPLWAIPYRLGF
jgi:hypothetical protein